MRVTYSKSFITVIIMGGSTFKEHGLSTPRMPPAIYRFALKQLEERLSTLYRKVAHCIEGPDKKDYGDLDILVLPDLEEPTPSIDNISALLNAKAYYKLSEGVFTLAIPWPSEGSITPSKSQLASVIGETVDLTTQNPAQSPELYIQLDLRICTSQQEFTWHLFAQGHGDLINIISAIIRHKGLTITDQALYLRIQNLETHNKKLARVELSRDPSQVLRYLGLDSSRFWHPFRSLDEMMAYIATCRFHNPARVNSADTTELDRENVTCTTLHARNNKALDKRPIFQYWFQTYLPAHINDAHGPSAHLTRDQVVQDAFSFFGPELQTRYEQQKAHHTTIIQRSQLWTNIRTRILASNPAISDRDLHDTLKGLKREILLPPSPFLTPPSLLKTAYSTNDFSTLVSHAASTHTEVLTRYRHWLRDNSNAIDHPLDTRKTNPHSHSELEVYTAEDDRVLAGMKSKGSTWLEILDVLGKKSKSQLQAHWKSLKMTTKEPGKSKSAV